MSNHLHCLLAASAGTGKTYRLSSRFLELMFMGVEPDRVLATTFTRKAAGEILDRVLERLVDAARHEKELSALNESMPAVNVTKQDCEAKLSELTRRIDRFKIRTLDSFFVHVAQLFSLDLGLTPGWTILDEASDAVLREEALSRLIEAADEGEIVGLLRALSASAATRSVRNSLDKAVQDGRAAFLESRKEAWQCFDPGKALDDAAVAAAGVALRECEIPLTQKGTPVKNWEKAILALGGYFAEGDWKGLLGNGLVKKFLAGDSYAKNPIDPVIFQPVVDHALQQCLTDLARKNEALYRFLESFELHYNELKAQHAGYRFEDVPARIAPLGSNGFEQLTARQLDMWFRLDSRIDHLLLDEFQDTAPVQWRILNNLADQILAEATGERSLFVVGDVKQSIYSWREAEPRLFSSLKDRFEALRAGGSKEEFAIETMSKSYRSSRIVLETVNLVFKDISESTAFDEGPRADAARTWSESFGLHESAVEKRGCAYLLQAEKVEGAKDEIQVLQLAMDRVLSISNEAPGCTIGILMRRNTHISRCINMLRERGIRASGEGGNKLTDSAAVQQVLSVLHFADHPGDTLAAFHVSTSPLGPALGLKDGVDEVDRCKVASGIRRALAEDGYGAFINDLILRCDSDGYSEWDRRRLAQLTELAFAYEGEATLRPSAFVKLVRIKAVEDPSSARVKVMTIHASKGLEFDVVVLPELDGKPRGMNSIVSVRDEDNLTDPLVAVSATSTEDLMRSNESLEVLWSTAQKTDTSEFLSVIYVAMTRAVHRLEMIVQHPPKSGKSLTPARVLREALGSGEPGENRVIWAHPENQEPWFDKPQEAVKKEQTVRPELLAMKGGARDLSRQSPSSHEGGATRSGISLLEVRSDKAATRGLLFHRWFEEIEWLEEFTASDDELMQLGLRIERDEAVVRATLADFRKSLEHEDIKSLLTRGTREIEAVWRERSFSLVLPDENGVDALWNGTFDRIVLTADCAEIIDYKSDHISPEQVETRAQSHAPQLAAYERVLTRMLAPRKLRIERKLAFVHPGVVADLE